MAPPRHVIRFTDGSEMPVGKIICLARTYRKHAEEMGGEVREEPLLFLKPSSAVIFDRQNIVLPRKSRDVHHEVEMTLVIGRQGKNIPVGESLRYIAGYCLALDITARDLQQEAKEHGWPWTIAKGFDTFCPLSRAVPAGEVGNPHNLELLLAVNGEIRQRATTASLAYTVQEIVAYVSTLMTLERGDIILTGTPEGVGALKSGDVVTASLGDVCHLSHPVVGETRVTGKQGREKGEEGG